MEQQAVRKTYRYKLKLTLVQERALEMVLSRCCVLYNTALEQRKVWWERGQGIGATYTQQKAALTKLKATRPEFAEVCAQVLQAVLLRVERSYQAFFRRVVAEEQPGYPRLHGRGRYHSFTYPQIGAQGGARLDNGYFVLSKVGRIAVRWSRPLAGIPKNVTLFKEADGWYVSFSCVEVPAQPLPQVGSETGIDVGLRVLLMTADGAAVENPHHYRKVEKQLTKAQKRLSRRKKRSKRWWKAARLLARKDQKVRRQRRDLHHKTALALVRQHDVLYLEDLRAANLVRNWLLSKSISDAGWYHFRTTVTYKAACASKHVVLVESAFPTQDRSACGERVPKSLSIRTHSCPSCGFITDRNHNAALHMLRAGQARQGAVAEAAVVN